jgi:hypothetical protein
MEGEAKDLKERVSMKGEPWMKMLQVRMTIRKIDRKRDMVFVRKED